MIVVGILGVMAALAAAFVAMAQLERRASEQRVNAAKAYLLARSGIEDALARLDLGQDPAYGGENWDGSAEGLLSAFEAQQEVYQRTGTGTPADVESCPARHAMRPSFFVRALPAADPATQAVAGRQRGYSGLLSGEYAEGGNAYALKVQSSNAGIYINGGTLDAEDRDPDGPGAKREDFPLNPNAAAEVAPLLPDGIPDHRDASMEGPNGFLVRLLNNLDAVVTNGETSNLGVQIVENRPSGGYKSLEELKEILGPRYSSFAPYLTTAAWVDQKVVKPQPMDGRPHRWKDIDDTHRIGTVAPEISGVKPLPGAITLLPLILGSGTQGSPWTQSITVINMYEGVVSIGVGQIQRSAGPKIYPVLWERNYVYAWNQLRPAPIAMEPRAPVSIQSAAVPVLGAVFQGLKGSYLEVWDGSAGWDGGFGWYTSWDTLLQVVQDAASSPPFTPRGSYVYPSQAAEKTPWHRTRQDYGMTCGISQRPWYGPRSYDPHAVPDSHGGGGRPVIQAAPLGRLKETPPLSAPQAMAIAEEIRRCVAERGPFRTWGQFGTFVKALPMWEDLNNDGILDGPPYTVNGDGGYTRRTYRREDLDSDGKMTRQVFTVASGSWREGDITWVNRGTASLEAGDVAGLTFVQKDVLKAMANPNTDLNDFNPDANLWKEVDKTDVVGIGTGPYGPDAAAYVHTTELALELETVNVRLDSLGRVTGGRGQLLARRGLAASFSLGGVYRDTTQSDFLRASPEGQFATPYPLAGDQPLLSWPEPQAPLGEGGAAYDGRLSLGLIGPLAGPDETLRGDLFGTVDLVASGDQAVPDLRGPSRGLLLRSAGLEGGQVFPDGVYSEKDRALAYPIAGNFNDDLASGAVFYIACWAKPHWFPETSPRAHALISLSCGGEAAEGYNAYAVPYRHVPLDEIPTRPMGLYFVPARNNAWEETVGAYQHDASSTRGGAWPRRALLWGTVHSLFASDTLNRRGIVGGTTSQKPMGRLEQHRWQHVAMMGKLDRNAVGPGQGSSVLVLGRRPASGSGGGWNRKFGASSWDRALRSTHADGSENHLRFGEFATAPNMNYAADATFANIRAGSRADGDADRHDSPYEPFFTGASGPAALGRYLKEHGTAYTSRTLPGGIRPLRITWTEIPCDLWFDKDPPGTFGSGWLGDDDNGNRLPDPGEYQPTNDQFSAGGKPGPNGLRDVHIALEVWDDLGTDEKSDDVKLARFDDSAADNRIPGPIGRIYYKAVFVNEWDPDTRANFPLDVTPFLDDVTITMQDAGGPRILGYEVDGTE